jgi:hypothetical protein
MKASQRLFFASGYSIILHDLEAIFEAETGNKRL